MALPVDSDNSAELYKHPGWEKPLPSSLATTLDNVPLHYLIWVVFTL